MLPPEKIPYKKGTLAYNLMVDDWSDLTAAQIAEVLGLSGQSVKTAIQRIRKKTGYQIPYVKLKRGRPKKENQ